MRSERHADDLRRIDLRPGVAADAVTLGDLVYLVIDAEGHPLAVDFVAADAFPFLRARGGSLDIPACVAPDTPDAIWADEQGTPRARIA